MHYHSNDYLDQIPPREILAITQKLIEIVQTLNQYSLSIHLAQEYRDSCDQYVERQLDPEIEKLF